MKIVVRVNEQAMPELHQALAQCDPQNRAERLRSLALQGLMANQGQQWPATRPEPVAIASGGDTGSPSVPPDGANEPPSPCSDDAVVNPASDANEDTDEASTAAENEPDTETQLAIAKNFAKRFSG